MNVRTWLLFLAICTCGTAFLCLLRTGKARNPVPSGVLELRSVSPSSRLVAELFVDRSGGATVPIAYQLSLLSAED